MFYELTITNIKYPKNESFEYVYESLDTLFKYLKEWIEDGKISKNSIIRIDTRSN